MSRNNKIPILYLDNSYTFGGAINSLEYLVRALDKDRYEPILVTGQPEDFLSEHFSDITCYHIDLKLQWVNNDFYKALVSVPLFRNRFMLRTLDFLRGIYWIVFHDIPEALKYYRIGRRHNVKLVHLNNILGSQLSGILAAQMLGVPCVAHLRDFEKSSLSTRTHARLIHHHIAISSAIRDNLLELGVPREKISIIHDAIDLDEFNDAVDTGYLEKEYAVKPEHKLFGVFGRVIGWKGIREFILAAAKVIEKNPNARAFVVGSPSDGGEEYYNEVVELTKSLGIERNVVFTGYRKDVPALMKLMDVIVHSSITPEPFGMVVIEGMAMGKPVVATRGGGPIDIVAEGETGFLVQMGNSNEMAEKLLTLFNNKKLSSDMGRKGRARVELMFCKERYARQVEKVYANAVNAYGKRQILEIIKDFIPAQIKRNLKCTFKNITDSIKYFLTDNPAGDKLSGSKNILFVCKGNICRSVFAEHLLKMMFQGNGDDLVIRSCGLDASQSGQSPDDAITVAKEYGLDLTNHVPKPVTLSYLEEADIVLAMEYSQLSALKKQYPRHADKLRLLREFAPFPHNLFVNIYDPYGWNILEFRKSFKTIDQSLFGLFKRMGK
ncbi:MAG TPA: glycosyltransferase [Deltaproteobacteria bacterium]|nr:glycosyltransferase [Deltaproteobacteria bacterium]